MAYVIYRMVMRLFVLWTITVAFKMAMHIIVPRAVAMIVGHGVDAVDILFSMRMLFVIFVLHA
jgi:hypothetical protein